MTDPTPEQKAIEISEDGRPLHRGPWTQAEPVDLEAIKARLAAVSDGPWIYNGYSGIQAPPYFEADEQAPDYPPKPRPCTVTGIAFDKADNAWLKQRDEAYAADSTVAWVPAHYGDTATGRHAADAEFMAEARQDIPVLVATIEALRGQLAKARGHVESADDEVATALEHLRTGRYGNAIECLEIVEAVLDDTLAALDPSGQRGGAGL